MRIKNLQATFFAKQYRPAPQWIRFRISGHSSDRRSRTTAGRTFAPCNGSAHWAS